MKRVLPMLIVVVVLLGFVGTLGFLWKKSQPEPEAVQLDAPVVTDIVKKTVATGAIVPRNEVAIKPRVSGIVEVVHVEPGAQVERGTLLAEIAIVPNSQQLASARSNVSSAEISLANAKRDLDRVQGLAGQGAVSRTQLELAQTQFALREEELKAARTNLRIIRDGASAGAGANVSTEVRSTVTGMVLSVPIKVGESVIESNNFNDGTTIAEVADMGDLIFQGTVDESEVGRIAVGMPLEITIGAYPDNRFTGTLEYIAPKGQDAQGAVAFEIRAALDAQDQVFIRAGCSANADIVLEKAEQVLAVRESTLIFDDAGTWVEVETAPDTFERRQVELGISDGLFVEVLSGVGESDAVKRQESGRPGGRPRG